MMKRVLFLLVLVVFAAPRFVAAATLIHRYTFDGAGPTVVDSVGGANGVLVGGASLAGGNLVLDGSSGHVQLNQKIVPTGASAFSVTLVAQQLSARAGAHVEMISQGFSQNIPGSAGFYIGHRPISQFQDRNIRLTDQILNTGVPFPDDGLFHFYALTSNATGTRFFIDSIQVFTSATQLTPIVGGSNTCFGNQFCSQSFTEFFHGLIDDVRVYSGALTSAEIRAIQGQGCPASDPIVGIDEAISQIGALKDAAGLDFGTAQTLVQKVEEAKDKFTLGDRHDARSKMSNFVVELEAAVISGSLATEDANELLNKAGCILATMTFE